MLEMLESVGACSYIHRDVHTQSEVRHVLDDWTGNKRYDHWSVLYIASHGSGGVVHLGRKQDVTLPELGEWLEGKLSGKVVYFGSCSVLRRRNEALDFFDRTGAHSVIGYTKIVDWVTSAAFETALFGALGTFSRIGDALNYVERDAPKSLARTLGFRRFPEA